MISHFVYSTESKDAVSKVGGRGYVITKVEVKVTLDNATKAQRGGVEVKLYSFFNIGARWCGWVVNATSRPLYPRERPGTHCIGGWIGPRTGLDGCGKSCPTGIRSPDPPARIKSLYRLSYRAHYVITDFHRNSLMETVLAQVRFAPIARYFSLFEDEQTWSGVHPVGTGRSFLMSKSFGM
jgi:hypothetical protein